MPSGQTGFGGPAGCEPHRVQEWSSWLGLSNRPGVERCALELAIQRWWPHFQSHRWIALHPLLHRNLGAGGGTCHQVAP